MIKISEMTPATLPLAGTEELEIVQAGQSRRVAVSDVAAGNEITFDVLADIDTATPPTTEAVNGLYRVRDNQGVNDLMSLGFQASNQLELRNLMHGGTIRVGGEDSAGIFQEFILATSDSPQVSLLGGRATVSASSFATDVDVRITGDNALVLQERAAAPANEAGFGKYWVDNTVPSRPRFTDDAGNSYILNDHTSLLNVGTNTHAQIDTHIADSSLHFTEGSIDHTAILNVGVNSHAVIDAHIADGTIHFTEASIDHAAIQNVGTNSHAAIDTHIADSSIHFTQAAISITESQISDLQAYALASNTVTLTGTQTITGGNKTFRGPGGVSGTLVTLLSDDDDDGFQFVWGNSTTSITPRSLNGLTWDTASQLFYDRPNSRWGVETPFSLDGQIIDSARIGTWDTAASSGLDETAANALYLRLDASNDPVTGTVEFSNAYISRAGAGGTASSLRSTANWSVGTLNLPAINWSEADGTAHAQIRAFTTTGLNSFLDFYTGGFANNVMRLSADESFIAGASTGAGTNILQLRAGGSERFHFRSDGVFEWGASANYGQLTWSTNQALVIGQSGSTLQLGANGRSNDIVLTTAGAVQFNQNLQIFNSGGTDSVTHSHNGTDYVTSFINTTDWEIGSGGLSAIRYYSGLASATLAVGRNLNEQFDITVTDNSLTQTFTQDEVDSTPHQWFFNIATSNSGSRNFQFQDNGNSRFIINHLTGQIDIRDGYTLVIRDATDSDTVSFNMDGVDLNTNFVNTTDWNISGLTGAIQIGSGTDLRWLDAVQPWITLDSSNGGDSWSSQGAGISVGESGKKGAAAVHITYNGDGSGYIGMGAVDDTAGTGGRPGFGHFDFTYNNYNIGVGGLLYPGSTTGAVQFTGYIRSPSGNYGSIEVVGAAGSSGTWQGYSIGGRHVLMDNGSTTWGLYNDTNNEWVIQAIDNAGVTAYYNGLDVFRTASFSSTGVTSGAQVVDHGDTFRDVGFNVLPRFNSNASDTLEARHCGSLQQKSTSTARTLTLGSSSDLDFPVQGVTTVINSFTSGNYTINEGAGTTLYYLDGSTRTDTTGGCTLGPGGVATIWRESATVYYIWGSGITP